MKLIQICKNSGLTCEDFGYSGKHRQLPKYLRYIPQHLVHNEKVIRLVYFKPSFDDRFIEFRRDEIESIRVWNASVHKVIILVYNYMKNKYVALTMDDIHRKMFRTAKRERIDQFLFDNMDFDWRLPNAKMDIL